MQGPGGDAAPRRVSLVLDHFEIDNLQDGLVGTDEVSFLVIPVGEGAPAGSHVDLGAIRRGVRIEPQLDLVTYPDPDGLVSVQVAAVERDSDGFGELFAQFLSGADRLLSATTSLDFLDGESLGRSQEEILALTLEQLTADDGQLVNDHDLVGICWLTLDLGDDEPQPEVSSGIDCDGRTDSETVRLTFVGERGQWTSGLSFRFVE